MKKTKGKIIGAFLIFALLLAQTAAVFAADSSGPKYGYTTKTLREADKVNPYEFFEIDLTVPNYLGTIKSTLKTSEGEGEVEVLVIYVPNEKWDGDSYYSGITGKIKNDLGLHIYSGYDTLVGWKEYYNYGFLTVDGGTYSYDDNSIALHFLRGPGLYTGLATFPFSIDDNGIEEYSDAQLYVAPEDIFMTVAGYQFVLLLNDQTVDYYLSRGVIENGASCRFEGLRELLLEKQYIAEEAEKVNGLSNFRQTEYYIKGLFTDIPETAPQAWYDDYIQTVFNLGLMKGRADGSFDPRGNVTIAECLAMAARINDIYNGGSGQFSQGETWYNVYVYYCMQKGIIKPADFPDYTRVATRAQMAYILGSAIPEEAFQEINRVEDIPDVSPLTFHEEVIYMLYRAGVLTGYSDGSFAPDSPITRAETAAILSRIVKENLRVEF